MVRLHADGTPDGSFGLNGREHVKFDTWSEATAVAVDPVSGKIIVAGRVGGTSGNLAVARLLPSGAADTTFDGDGQTVVSPGWFYSSTPRMALQTDGQIVLAYNVWDFERDPRLAVLRLSTDGTLDPAFGSGGRVREGFGPLDRSSSAAGVALQREGSRTYFVLVGSGRVTSPTNADVAVLRLSPVGAVDPGFGAPGTFGKVTVAFDHSNPNDAAHAVAVQPDGKVVLAGQVDRGNGEWDFGVLIGGLGADALVGGDDDDLLIAGYTTYDNDNDNESLASVRSEWGRGDLDYPERVAALRAYLSPETVFNDMAVDEVYGQAGRDWFWADASDPSDRDSLTEFLN